MRKLPVSERFLQSFDDPAIFDCGSFNLLKVAQDALIREVGTKKKGFLHTLFTQPKWFLKIYFPIKSLLKPPTRLEIPQRLRELNLLAIIPARFVTDGSGKTENQYLGNLLNHIPREELLLMYLEPTTNTPLAPDSTKSELMQAFDSEAPSGSEWQLIADLKQCLNRIKKEGRFSESELKNIAVGLDEFWRQYRVFNQYFKKLNLKKALLIPGYYTEYVIAALKSNRVEVIEIQHGVITPASHFYIYPDKIKPVSKRALFAERIWVLGQYWKDQLLRGAEFESGQIDILGDYFVRHATPPNHPERLQIFADQFPELVLVGTQTKRHDAFKSLVKSLSERYRETQSQTGIVLKPHPAEDPALYKELENLANVFITAASLDYMYPICNVYISMYSNTLFEAARHDHLEIFVLRTNETAELADGIAGSGVAQILNSGDDPLEMLSEENNAQKPSADYFFQQRLNTELLDCLRTN